METSYSLSTLTVPLDLKCPLSNRVFVDPVTAADGYTYERASILKHLDTSLKSPTSGMLLLHINLIPNARKQALAQQWMVSVGNAAFQHASKCSQSLASGINQDQEALDTLIQLKDLIGGEAFFENIEWPNLVMTVAERMIEPYYANVAPGTSSVDKAEDAQAKLSPLRILYDIYLAYYLQDAECPYKDDFVRVRTELAKCYFALGEHGLLEALLHKHKVFNTAPLWRILVNEQVSFGWKKVAAKSCISMAKFAEVNGLTALAATAREEAFGLDPNIKLDGSDFGTVSFMTKEELRLATREEIVSGFKVDPNSQLNYEHLVDFLEDEGAIVSAVRVIVAHSLMKNVPVQFQANAALPLRRLVTLVAHLQSKYIPQLQILSTEANNYRTQAGLAPLNPPDLESLLKQASNEEEYKAVVASILETIQGRIVPPVASGTGVGLASGSGAPSSPSTSVSTMTPIPAISSSSPTKAALRSSWGVKPGQGKDRNKRFTMGIKTQFSGGGGFLGSRSQQEFLQQPATSTSAALPPTDPNARTPGPGRPPANFVWGPNSTTSKVGPPPAIGENPVFSQPLVPPSRLHTPSTLTPFDGNLSLLTSGITPASPMNFESDDSPFSSTVFNAMTTHIGTPDSTSLSSTPTHHTMPFSTHTQATPTTTIPAATTTTTPTTMTTSTAGWNTAPHSSLAQPTSLVYDPHTSIASSTGLSNSSSSLNSSNSSLPSYGGAGHLASSSPLLGSPAPLLAGSNLGGSTPALPIASPLFVGTGIPNHGMVNSSSNPMLSGGLYSPPSSLGTTGANSLPSNTSLLMAPNGGAGSGLLPSSMPLLAPSSISTGSTTPALGLGTTVSLQTNSLTPPVTLSSPALGSNSPLRSTSPSPLTGPALSGSPVYGYNPGGYSSGPSYSQSPFSNPALTGSNPALYNPALGTPPNSGSPAPQ